MPASSDHIHYQVLRLIVENPRITQREMASALGVSLGKANYCLKALLEKGWIKANNFKNSRNKMGYAYLLTPGGLEAKARLAMRFLAGKIREYEALEAEIQRLKKDLESMGLGNTRR
ncbi:MAG: MarR family EPS-associated transcriptional regulator [Porticoccaceae bacterium]|jgi:EPS-associated MarR family transcriptional regulator|nr:MarR family EPS-associated transcriptional regulator [Porticoccaceae bacterium]